MKKNVWIMLAVLALAALFQAWTIQSGSLRIGQPLAAEPGMLLLPVEFSDGYGVVVFDSAEAAQAFARLPSVGVRPRPATIKIQGGTR